MAHGILAQQSWWDGAKRNHTASTSEDCGLRYLHGRQGRSNTVIRSVATAPHRHACVQWHLGVGKDGEYLPHNRGFDHYYGVPYGIDMCAQEHERRIIRDGEPAGACFAPNVSCAAAEAHPGPVQVVRAPGCLAYKLLVGLVGVVGLWATRALYGRTYVHTPQFTPCE